MKVKSQHTGNVSLVKLGGSTVSSKILTLKNNMERSKHRVIKSGTKWRTSTILTTLSSVWSHSPSCKRGFQQVRKSAIGRFKYVAKMVMACVVWGRRDLIRKDVQKHASIMSFMQADSNPSNLLFDASMFKANKEMGLHHEVRRILSLPSDEKTDQQLQFALIALRNIPSFAEYPTPMQKQMCRLGWYQRVDPSRVIIKEGQMAYNFYFILTGTVVITELDKVTKSSQTKCMLQSGMEFGEQALFKKTYRSATVMSHTTTELLCLDARDMSATYLCGRDAPIKDQQIISFLSGLHFLQGFPLSILESNTEALMFHYFKPGQVLVRDTRYSDWLYVVKSGSISVLKKLNSFELRSEKFQSAQNVKLRSLLSLMDRQSKHNRESAVATLNKLMSWKPQVLQKNSTNPPVSKLEVPPQTLTAPKFSRLTLPCIYEELEAVPVHDSELAQFARGTSSRPHISPSLPPLVESKMSIVSLLDAGRRASDPSCDREGSDKPTFITVCMLEKGQCFGIATTIFRDQPSLSVISNGADCLLLSKQFYFKHCSEQMLNKLKEQELPYPTDYELLRKLRDYNKWTKFKSEHYKHAVRQAKRS